MWQYSYGSKSKTGIEPGAMVFDVKAHAGNCRDVPGGRLEPGDVHHIRALCKEDGLLVNIPIQEGS